MFSLFGVLSFLGALIAVNSFVKTWSYYPISITTKTADETMLKADLRVERMSRTEYAISGSVDLNYDMTVDNFVELLVYFSSSGSSDYKRLPFAVKKTPVYDAFNTFYKDLVMESFANCSNLPQFEDKFEPPFEKKTYVLDKCQISNEKLPQNMQYGFYKIVIEYSGTLEWSIEALTKIDPY